MTAALVGIIVLLAGGLAVVGRLYARDRRSRSRPLETCTQRILFPFVGRSLSRRALDAALRLAVADHATLVPVFLARVPLQMSLDAAVPRQCMEGMPLLETIEQRGAACGVPVDSRVERGRTPRHALREAIEHERYDRVLVAAATPSTAGFHGEDIAWLLDHAPGEVVIVRPDDDDVIEADARRGSVTLALEREVRHAAVRRIAHDPQAPWPPSPVAPPPRPALTSSSSTSARGSVS
jgi:hypothetical protein